MTARTVAITGASGMLGTHLAEHFRRRGWNVRALSRDPSWDRFREKGIEQSKLDLERAIPRDVLAGADVVIHAAYTTRFRDLESARRVNIDGTRNLLEAARQARVERFVFVSSLAARADAPSFYGRSKHQLEQLMIAPGDLIIRPGLIIAPDGGLAHRLQQSIARTHLVPLFDGGRQIVQTVHVDDLCVAFERALRVEGARSFNVAEADGVTMREFLAMLARRAGTWTLSIPLPVAPALHVIRAFERAGMSLPISSENLLGLTGMRHVETRADLDRLGVTLRSARESTLF